MAMKLDDQRNGSAEADDIDGELRMAMHFERLRTMSLEELLYYILQSGR
jgi:hypothetical protein